MPAPYLPPKCIIANSDDAPWVNQIMHAACPPDIDMFLGRTSKSMVSACQQWAPALVIIDAQFADSNATGLDLVQDLRAAGYQGLIIVFSDLSSENERVLALRLGADDYVAKPNYLELAERVRILLRRNVTNYNPIEIERRTHVVRVRGERVLLSPKEFDLLAALVEADGAVLSKMDLLNRVWNITTYINTRTVECHIKQVRSKLRPYGLSAAIRTIPRVGFSWSVPAFPEKAEGVERRTA